MKIETKFNIGDECYFIDPRSWERTKDSVLSGTIDVIEAAVAYPEGAGVCCRVIYRVQYERPKGFKIWERIGEPNLFFTREEAEKELRER